MKNFPHYFLWCVPHLTPNKTYPNLPCWCLFDHKFQYSLIQVLYIHFELKKPCNQIQCIVTEKLVSLCSGHIWEVSLFQSHISNMGNRTVLLDKLKAAHLLQDPVSKNWGPYALGSSQHYLKAICTSITSTRLPLTQQIHMTIWTYSYW